MIEYRIEWFPTNPSRLAGVGQFLDGKFHRLVLAFNPGTTVAEAQVVVEALNNLARKRERNN